MPTSKAIQTKQLPQLQKGMMAGAVILGHKAVATADTAATMEWAAAIRAMTATPTTRTAANEA